LFFIETRCRAPVKTTKTATPSKHLTPFTTRREAQRGYTVPFMSVHAAKEEHKSKMTKSTQIKYNTEYTKTKLCSFSPYYNTRLGNETGLFCSVPKPTGDTFRKKLATLNITQHHHNTRQNRMTTANSKKHSWILGHAVASCWFTMQITDQRQNLKKKH